MSARRHVRFRVGGAEVDAVDLDQTVAIIADWIARREQHYVALLGAHGLVESQHDGALRRAYKSAALVVPDGMPLVWLGRLRGHAGVAKVTGAPLMDAVVAHGIALGYRHYFYGGLPGVAAELARRLERRHPGVDVAGVHAPAFGERDETEARRDEERIRAARCDVVWVGLGCPKQECWMARARPMLDAPVLVGVGAAFDFLAGQKPLAPGWVRHSGLEWLFRLATEPRRLWPRYRRVLPRFALIAARELAADRVRRPP